MIDSKYIIVGGGIFGSVIAERIASVMNESVTIIEKRSHIGGNCHSAIDKETGIECHRYGSHIFHTASEKVWQYVNQFTSFTNYRHKVMTISNGQIYSMPINLKTLCDVVQKSISPTEAQQMLNVARQPTIAAKNLEEKAIALIGPLLYEKFIRGYTLKQWNEDPKKLPPEIITRLPVRTNFNEDYFNDPYQGVPSDGYFSLFNKLLSNSNIKIVFNTDFLKIRKHISRDAKIIYTGMIDEYFDRCLGSLEWRTLRFDWETINVRDYQGTSVVNYADEDVPFTRIHEFKHYHPERRMPYDGNQTIICKEYSENWRVRQDAYYPVNTPKNQQLLAKYQEMGRQIPNLIFGGRLGCYCYWDMDKAILNALECFESQILEK